MFCSGLLQCWYELCRWGVTLFGCALEEKGELSLITVSNVPALIDLLSYMLYFKNLLLRQLNVIYIRVNRLNKF